jgi:hypothetical protein
MDRGLGGRFLLTFVAFIPLTLLLQLRHLGFLLWGEHAVHFDLGGRQ